MNTNKKKIAFIICVNNDIYFNECQYYISQLRIPDGYETEIIGIREASSMCAAYNAGMQSSDAKYKIYMHQDVFIRDRNFIASIVEIFSRNDKVGMIGMVGGIGMPKTGVTYLAWNVGCVDCREPDMAYKLICAPNQEQDMEVDAVDGLLIATQYDVSWREDLFCHFDFYDVSQSFEMRRRGYRIIVPYQKAPWVIHDSSFAKLNHYDVNRKICLQEYPEYFTEEDGFEFCYQEEWELLSDELVKEVKRLLDMGDWASVQYMLESYRKNNMKNSALEMFGIMSDIYAREQENEVQCRFFEQYAGWEAAYRKYMCVRFLLRRMEVGIPEADYAELIEAIRLGAVSCDSMIIMVIHSVLDKKSVLQKLEVYYEQAGQKENAQKIRYLYEKVLKDKDVVAYSKRVQKDRMKNYE